MKVGVVGLGLIGGSIFKGMDGKHDVVGVSRSVSEAGVSKDYSILSGCNVVFVCTPMNKTLEILDKLEEFLDENTIVTDVCSLKEFVSHKSYRYNLYLLILWPVLSITAGSILFRNYLKVLHGL